MKFGGSSVGDAQRIKNLAGLVNPNENTIVVLSAMSGMTDRLNDISGYARDGKYSLCVTRLIETAEYFKNTAINLFDDNDELNSAWQFITGSFDKLIDLVEKPWSQRSEYKLVSSGELITCQLAFRYFRSIGWDCGYLCATDYMTGDQYEPDYSATSKKLIELMANSENHNLYFTEGFICRNNENEVSNLGRGGSDYSATIIGSLLGASVIEIWSDRDGLLNNDPRFVSNTFPVENLTYREAEELAYFGAKILHPNSIEPAKRTGIPILLKNTFNPNAKGTLVYTDAMADEYKAVAAKDWVTAIKVHSGRMMNSYGFVNKIFEVFDKYRTPIDVITTSEVSVSITIDNIRYKDEIINELNRLGQTETFENQVIICVVGNFDTNTGEKLSSIFGSLGEIPVKMISFGSSRTNLTFITDSEYKSRILNILNQTLFHKKPCLAQNRF